MKTQTNGPERNVAQHQAPKRKWSTPTVIESEASGTDLHPHSATSPRDRVYFLRFGSGS